MVPVDIARADVAGAMNSFFQDAGGAANVTGPSAYQGQTAGYYSMGNVWTRFPQKSVQPFNLQMPKVSAGCGGIDLFTGSFSFINGAEMVAMLKATANNALGFAFQLAIDSVSPEIGKVMDGMANKAQQMNQMNISSCEAAQGLVGSVWPKMSGARSTICAAVGNSQGKFSDWAKSRQGCGPGGEMDATLKGNTDPAMADKIPGAPRNYTWDAIRKSNKFAGTDKEFSEFLMTLVGTIVINPDAPDGSIVGFVGPAEDAIVTALLDGAGTGTPVKILRCTDEEQCLNMTEQTLRPGPGLRSKIKGLIDSINLKIRADNALNTEEQQLLNMTTLPLYKMLAVQAMAHQNFADGETSALAEIVAVNLLSSMIENMLDRVSQSTVQVQPADAEMGKMWRDQLAEARQRYSQRDFKLKETLNQTIALINKSVMLESTLQNSMSPAMAASLNFSRGLSSQGLN
ncbi:conjugal transfer protein TraH [Sphingomonas sanguinis]|nr:conjugal transfer protein TraH [Sphingomonas sanguinis]MBZ6383062.1 conjugal transfer protein TraH [Sphingomonas sanguinis]NNG48210.1 conjugal transfer protein TraH [Sphingomonas sanguinis]NNG54956.1 conjugal transfer protein TraH [Sphingomonas sanguinis]